MSVIFVDIEGKSVQELCAIEMDSKTYKIIDVYHGFAMCYDNNDWFSRRYVHGLNVDFLREHGFSNSQNLIADFKSWLSDKSYLIMFANDSIYECEVLKPLHFEDLRLPPWIERVKMSYHQIAVRYKELNIPILNSSCFHDAHTSFRKSYSHALRNETMIVKAQHGHHCALYDCYELYLKYIMQ